MSKSTLLPSGSRSLGAALLMSAALLLAACQGATVRPDSDAQAVRARAAADEGQHVAAARLYQDLAGRSEGTAADHYRLLAAAQWLASGDLAQADSLMQAVKGPMQKNDYALWALLNARLALARNEPQQALDALQSAPSPPPQEMAPDFLAVRGLALFQLLRIEDAILAFMERETWLDSSDTILANQRNLLEQLESAANNGLLDALRSGDPLVQGWVDLGRISAASARDAPALLVELRAWRQLNPGHPASAGVVDQMLERYRSASRYPLQVGLLLPLSGRQQEFGEAVRDGFLAAYLHSSETGIRPLIRIYDSQALGAVAAYHQALAEGADMIVGPLLKAEVTQLTGVASGNVPVLALNLAGDAGYLPPAFYQYSLDPEEEARQAARQALRDGYYRGIALVPATPWGSRLLNAFGQALQEGGGTLLAASSYDPSEQDYSRAITGVLNLDASDQRFRQLADVLGKYPEFVPRRRQDVEFVFVGAQPAQARLIRPQLKFHYASTLQVYATSSIFEPDAMANKDLDGIRFADIPWNLQRPAQASPMLRQLRSTWPDRMENHGRLLAMGVDAFRLLPWLYAGDMPEALRGATGLLSLGTDGVIKRELDWAEFRGGRPEPLLLGDFVLGGSY